MKCPSCHKNFHPDFKNVDVGYCGRNEYFNYYWRVYHLFPDVVAEVRGMKPLAGWLGKDILAI